MEIYDQLLRFSLFQGMSHADLMEVVTHTKLGFMKLQQGKHLVKEGDSCTHLTFLTHGSLQCETLSDDGGCRVVETVKAPYIVQPDRLFGLSQRYSSTFRADRPSCLALSPQGPARTVGALLLLALYLSCWPQDILRLDEADCRRSQ